MADAGSWQEQLALSITTAEELSRVIRLDPAEEQGIREAGTVYRWRITPYYAGLMDPTDPRCPIRGRPFPLSKS